MVIKQNKCFVSKDVLKDFVLKNYAGRTGKSKPRCKQKQVSWFELIFVSMIKHLGF